MPYRRLSLNPVDATQTGFFLLSLCADKRAFGNDLKEIRLQFVNALFPTRKCRIYDG